MSAEVPEVHSPAVQSAVRKIFRRVVPLFFVMFVANYMDRVNLGFAQDELRADVGLSAAAFGLGAGIFFIAYAIFEVPSNMLMERFGAKVWLTRIMISWGVVATAMAFVDSVEMFYALRFLLGVAEAGFFPAVIYYFSRWLPDSHRGRATSIFLMGSGTATVIVGPVSGALMELHGIWGHAGWQWMFFIEGVFSVVYRFLDSGVEQATWLTDEEKSGLVAAIDAEQDERDARRGGKAARVSRWKLLADPQMLLFLWIYFAINVALYAVTFWLPSIVDDIGGVSDFQVGLLTAVPWLCALAALFVSGRVSDRIGRRRPVLVVLLLLGGCGTLLAVFVSPWVGLGALCLAAMGFKPASPVFWTIPQSYLDARAAAPGIALINSIGNLGGFVAPTAFGIIEDTTGSTKGGLVGLTVVGFLAALSVLLVRGGGRNDRVRTRPAKAVAAPAPETTPGAARTRSRVLPPPDATRPAPPHRRWRGAHWRGPHHARERTVTASTVSTDVPGATDVPVMPADERTHRHVPPEGSHRHPQVDPLAALRTPQDPPWDVYLTGTVFLDVIFTGLDSAPVRGTESWARGMGRARAASPTWRPRWPVSACAPRWPPPSATTTTATTAGTRSPRARASTCPRPAPCPAGTRR